MPSTATEEWLERRAPGYGILPAPDRQAIYDFSLLWSLFEAKIMAGKARVDRLTAQVDSWAEQDSLNADQYGEELAYFRARYFDGGEPTGLFHGLKLRDNDNPDIVTAVLSRADNTPRNQMLALVMIVWRYRNNLFHGAKWTIELRDQHDNFTHAGSVLMRLLDDHADLH